VCDLEQIGGHRADLLCLVVSMLFTWHVRVWRVGIRGEVMIAVVCGYWFETSDKELLFE
jgi:hypothetical protein